MSKQVWSVICSFVILSGCYIPEEVPESRMNGYVGFSYPVVGGHVRIWELHPIDGSLVHSDPIAETITDENGEFDVEISGPGKTLLVTVHNGTVQEFWTRDPIALPDVIHSIAVVPNWVNSDAYATVTPWTTLADGLSTYWHEHGSEKRPYVETLLDANEEIFDHLIDRGFRPELHFSDCRYNLACLKPIRANEIEHALMSHSPDDPEILHSVSLLSLSALSISRCRGRHEDFPDHRCSTRLVVDDLFADVSDNGLFDGLLDVSTTSETLRSELVKSAIEMYWETDWNTSGLMRNDLDSYFCKLINNSNKLLFGSRNQDQSRQYCNQPSYSEQEMPETGSAGSIKESGNASRSASKSTQGDSGLPLKNP